MCAENDRVVIEIRMACGNIASVEKISGPTIIFRIIDTDKDNKPTVEYEK